MPSQEILQARETLQTRKAELGSKHEQEAAEFEAVKFGLFCGVLPLANSSLLRSGRLSPERRNYNPSRLE